MQQLTKSNKTVVNNDRKNRRTRKRGKSNGNRQPSRTEVYGAAYNQLRRDIAFIMQFINTESKYIDTTSGGLVAMGVGYNINLVNPISLGTSSTTRTGQSVKCVGIELRWHAMIDPAATTCNVVRVYLVRDKAANAAQPTFTDIYPAGTVTPRVVAYLDRFQVLYQREVMLNNAGSGGQLGDYIAEQNWHQEFNTGNAGTIADITVNSLYLTWQTSVATDMPSFSYTCRYVYVDN
jgi:hypothetical protein